jgi:hypothetical protein
MIIPTSLVDRELDALIEQSRVQRKRLVQPSEKEVQQMEIIAALPFYDNDNKDDRP